MQVDIPASVSMLIESIHLMHKQICNSLGLGLELGARLRLRLATGLIGRQRKAEESAVLQRKVRRYGAFAASMTFETLVPLS